MLTTSTFDIWSVKENKLIKSIEHLASQVREYAENPHCFRYGTVAGLQIADISFMAVKDIFTFGTLILGHVSKKYTILNLYK